MALTRSMLKGMQLTDEQVSAIIDAHTETVNALKEQRDDFKRQRDALQETADKLPIVQKELDDLKNGEDFKAKWQQAVKDLNDYKSDVANKEKLAKVKAAYKNLLTEKKVGDKYIDSVMGVTDYSGMALDADGKLTNVETLGSEIENRWGGFITTTREQGAPVETPPAPAPAKLSKKEIMAIKDAGERQKAIAENHELFGF